MGRLKPVSRPPACHTPPPTYLHLCPTQHYEARLYKALLPTIAKGDVEAVAGRLVPEASAVYKTVEHRWAPPEPLSCWDGGTARLSRRVGGAQLHALAVTARLVPEASAVCKAVERR